MKTFRFPGGRSAYAATTVFLTTVLLAFSTPGGSAFSAAPHAGSREHKTQFSRQDLRGIVADSNGHPLPGATVFVYTAGPRVGVSIFCPSCYADCGKLQATDSQGRFHIPSLDGSLIFRLLVVREGYSPTFVPDMDPLRNDTVRIKMTQARQRDLERTVTGTVVGPDGRPLFGATVEPFGVRSLGGKEFGNIAGLDPLAVTDRQGRFRFHCPEPGAMIYARVKARGLAARVVPSLSPHSGGAGNRIALMEGASLQGIVRDSHGRGIPYVMVEVGQADTDMETFTGWQDIGTDAAGRFLASNLPSSRQVVVCVKMKPLLRLGLGALRRIVKTGKDGTVIRNVDIVAGKAATVTGRVSLSDGHPIPGGTPILLDRTGTGDTQEATLAPTGSFLFHGVPAGEKICISVAVRGYPQAAGTPGYGRFYYDIPPVLSADIVNKAILITLAPAR